MEPFVSAPAAGELAVLLKDKRDDIVQRFVNEVRGRELSPPATSRSHLENQIPRFLDEMIAELTTRRRVRFTNDSDDESPTAREHGEQRWELGYDLEALVREYGILRHCLLQCAAE